MNDPIIVSYYTKRSCYEKEAKELADSLKNLQLDYEIDEIDDLGTWNKNCCHKPEFLYEKLIKYQRPIVWIDSDSRILKKPSLFYSATFDLALRIRPSFETNDSNKISSGTLYFAYTPLVLEFLRDWQAECLHQNQKTIEVSDQDCLKTTLFKYFNKLKIYSLPISYCKIFDHPEDKSFDDVIVHFQASRFYKKIIDHQLADFPFLEAT